MFCDIAAIKAITMMSQEGSKEGNVDNEETDINGLICLAAQLALEV